MTSPFDRVARRDDSGFTLLEVIVAVVLLGIVMAGSATFFVRGISTAADRERRAAAVALADQTMELVRAVAPGQSSGVQSKLLQGRSQTETLSRWSAAVAPGTELGDSEPAFATSVPCPAVLLPACPSTTFTPVPFESQHAIGSQDFTVHTYVGTCQRTNVQSASCTRTGSGAQLFRVVVQVVWDQGSGTSCSGGRCEYIIATLVDPSSDPIFNSNSATVLPPVPVADADAATTAYASPVSIDVLDGDTGDLEAAPVTIITPSPNGGVTGPPSNPVTFTPALGFYGTTTFTYQLTDKYGRTSNTATVTVTVTRPAPPVANDDSYSVLAGSTTDLNVLANDTAAAADTVSGSAGAPTQASRGVFRYTAPATAGTFTFTYALRENATNQTDDATVRITVTVPPGPVAVNDAVTVNRGSTTNINLLANDSNLGNLAGITLSSVSGGGSVTGTATQGVVAFTAGSSAGTASFTYTLRDAFGQTATGTVTVTVRTGPTVLSRALCVTRNGQFTAAVVTNFTSTSAPYTIQYLSGTGQGTFSFQGTTAVLTHRAPNNNANYDVRYRVTDRFGVQSDVGTISVDVKGSC